MFFKATIMKDHWAISFLNHPLLVLTMVSYLLNLKKDFKIVLPTKRTTPRGITQHKKTEICQKLLPLIPVASHPFWNELSESETSCDLLTKNDED